MQTNGKKRQAWPEIYLLLNAGLAPKQIISLGYSQGTVYKYGRELKEAKGRIEKLFSTNAANALSG